MKKTTTFLMGISVVMVLLVACNKKDDPSPPGDDNLKVEGSWQVEKVDFADAESIAWDDSIPYNFSSKFGYAPYMYTIMQGYVFEDAKLDNDTIDGNVFNFILESEFGEEGVVYWYWNYTDGGDGFEIVQLNIAGGPPNNFSILNVGNAELSEDGELLVFGAEMYSRVPGKPIVVRTLVPVEITLRKGEITRNAEVFIEGEPFVEP